MPASTIQKPQPNWTIISLIAGATAFIFFQPFLGAICFAALMAYMMSPIHRKFSKRMPENISAPIVLVLSYLIILLPLAFIAVLAVTQAVNLANYLMTSSQSAADASVGVNNINEFLASMNIPLQVSGEQINTFVQQTLPDILSQLANSAAAVLGSLPQLITSIIIYSFLFTAFLRFNKSLQQFLKNISPFEENMSEKYIRKSALIVSASLKGQFVISFVTALGCALLLFAFGLQSYFLFFVVLFTILGMIPLGSGIVMIPLSIVYMLTGHFWEGFWVLLIYLLVICNFDTVLRPRLIPKQAKILPAVTMLATFCGLYYFGFLGVVYGPLIVILLMTTVEIYLSTHSRDVPAKVTA